MATEAGAETAATPLNIGGTILEPAMGFSFSCALVHCICVIGSVPSKEKDDDDEFGFSSQTSFDSVPPRITLSTPTDDEGNYHIDAITTLIIDPSLSCSYKSSNSTKARTK